MSRQRSPHAGASTVQPDEVKSAHYNSPAHARKSPQTPIERLTENLMQDDSNENLEADSGTILYLAYGSNLCEETFRGKRGIRPLSEINVSAPTLRLTMSLPGVPYAEPCFGNVAFRKLPEKPKLPDHPKLPFDPPAYSKGQWDGGLMGVVYEVTKADYRKIMATEGGGSGYQEIFVPCVPLPPSVSIPEKPPLPELPRPFLARTLYAPYLPPDDPSRSTWWKRLFSGTRRKDPDYAQPSARYLKLITDGAEEHNLPAAYQGWLHSLQPYTVTSTRQKIGKLVLMATIGPMFLTFMALAKYTADENGRYPWIVAQTMTLLFNTTWVLYDWILKPLFGDGERTQGVEDECQPAMSKRRLSIGKPQPDEEKTSLLRGEVS